MSGEGPAILVVDDNENNRYTLSRRLKREGYENLSSAENGREALEVLAEKAIDLVLLDIMMPEMNGYQVLETMKADMDLRDIPVIVISAVDDLDSVARCIEMGAEDYLPKPFNKVLLRARVGASLEKKKLRDQESSYLERLEWEKKRADDLLGAILPPGALRELKTTNEVKSRRYDDVAVLFCDVVGFTRYCDEHPAEKVVLELQALVAAFEDIAERHGMEKIKTIGDAFLATAGLLTAVDEPLLASVRCGLDMVAISREMEPHWEVRVGIHQGPVVAGIMGQRQYLFDLWGDTVNTAARILDQAPPSTVVMSGPAYMQVRGQCKGKSQGMVELKGKGALEVVECLEVT
jgi:class 3 adenylate cyclase